MRRKIFIFVLLTAAKAFVGVAEAWGQQAGEEGRIMTLRECMAYAISNSTKVRIQQAAIGDARIARRDAALALFTPTLSGQTYAYYNFGRSIDPQTNTYFNTTSFHNNYSVSLGYDLFDGFQAVNNHKISKTGMLIAQSQEKQVEADICLAVMEAYYNVVYYKRLSDVYEEQVKAAEESLKLARRQEELGQKGHADVVEMEANLADRQYDFTNTHNMYLNQKMVLADLMFWPEDEELEVTSNLKELSTSAFHTGLTLDENILGDTETDAQNVVDYALAHNPDMQIASWQQLNARRELHTAKWQTLPTVGLYAGWNTSYYSYQGSATASFGNQFRNNRGEYVEMSISIPLWDRMSRASKISRKRHAYEKATAELDQKRRDVESEVRRAIQDRDGSATAYRQAQRKGAVQAEAYQLNQKKLEQGLISPLEFQTATGNYLKAQADEMNSLFKYLIKHAVVKYYNGVEYIEQ
ncbi:MAG: TolC family protein [Bacteroidaceae bacterium]|nr:TolC family protein [Bacteroidaceae bacterium]